VFGKLERNIELSDLLSDTAVVYKTFQSGDDQTGSGFVLDSASGSLGFGLAFGSSMSRSERYDIKFKGGKVTISLDNRGLFEKFSNGDCVRLDYKEGHWVTRDYVRPNFDEKQVVDVVFSGNYFVDAEKLLG